VLLTESTSSILRYDLHKICSDKARPLDFLRSLSANHPACRLLPSDVTVTSRSSRGIPRRRRPPETLMDDVDNDDETGTGNAGGDRRGNDDNNNKDDDDDDDANVGPTTDGAPPTMTSEETLPPRCRAVAETETHQLSSTVTSNIGRYWHCSHIACCAGSVRLSVCMSHLAAARLCCRFAAVGPAGKRYRLIAAAAACGCGQCHVVSVRK